jgi:hypothetical protein
MKRLSVFAVLLLCVSEAFGQNGLATITGTVTDPSGASVVDAPIEVRNLENGSIFRAASSQTGNYTVSQLPVGDYDLTITVPGFKSHTHTKFHLSAAQVMREDVSLQVGSTSESVTVSAESSLLKTENSELVHNVTLSQLDDLPVLAVGATNSGFRDPFSAVRLVPGIRYTNGTNVAAGTTGATTTMVVNGTPANTYGTRLDGMTMNPTGPRLIGAQMQTQPSVDAIQEVAIETSNFAAEFGTAGGAMINMVTKSGGNSFHGTAYDYGTNEALNARQPYTGFKNKIRQHDWGFTIGGPVKIPKLYDGTNKTFFYWSYERFQQTNVVNTNASVPTAAYRTGDFSSVITAENRLITTATGNATDALGRTMLSGTIFDPNTQQVVNGRAVRDPFPGNRIPLARFDPITVKILPLIPNPVGPNFDRGLVANNFSGTYDTSRRSHIPSIKIDQVMGKGKLSFYLQETNTSSPRSPTGADPFPDSITAGITTFSSGTTVRLNYDHTLTSRLLLHVGVGWNDSDFVLESPNANYDAAKTLGLVGQTEARYFPRIVTAANTNDQVGGMSSIGTVSPTASFERRPSATASATYVNGSHTYKLGADWRMETFPNYPRSSLTSNTTGTYTFGANMTEQPSLQGVTTNQGFDGFEFASFLLGGVSSTSQVAPIALANRKKQFALFLQDTWKVSRKLTLDYGVRWDYGTYAHEQYGRNASIGLAVPNPSAAGRLGASQFESVCKCNFANNYPYAIGPRLGVAYQINSKTVVRAGFGVVYNSTTTASGSAAASAASSTLPTNSGQITSLFKDGMPLNARAVWPSTDPGVGQGAGSVVTFPNLLDQNAGRPARLTQWNISLQREINRNLVVEAAYVGNRGVWWSSGTTGGSNGLAPLNALSQDTLRAYGFNDFTSLSEAQLLTTTISALTAQQRATLSARGISLTPYSNFPTSQTVRQALLAYPQYSAPVVIGNAPAYSGLIGAPLGNTWYDSFQLNITKRFSHGLAANVNYNFAKNLDTMTTTGDVFNRGLSKNLSTWDLPHQLRITAQYVVPRPSFVQNRVLAYVLSDWGIGASMSYQSASILTRPSSNGTVPISQFLGRGPGPAQLKKNPDGSYMNPWSVNWFDNDGKQRTDPIDINCHCFDPTKVQAFNPAAWENVPNGQWAADYSALRWFRGVRTPSENMNFSRNFRVKEGISLNVRVEFNNIFNRMQLGGLGVGPSTTGNFAATPTKFTTGPSTGLYSGGFGTFQVLNGVNGQRIGTFVARLTF